MDASDPDPLMDAPDLDIHIAMLRQRLIVLRDLVALRKIRVEVILAGENRAGINSAVQRQRGFDRELYRMAAQDRKSSRQPQANRANVGIRRSAETGRAATKDLGACRELDVHFQADYRLVPGDRLRGHGGGHARRHESHYTGQAASPDKIPGTFPPKGTYGENRCCNA